MKTLVALLLLIFASCDAFCANLSLAWDNPCSNCSVRLHWGTQTHNYVFTSNLGNVSTTTVSGLSYGTTYYFMLTAVDPATQVESLPGGELAYALAPPTPTPSPTPANITVSGSIKFCGTNAPATGVGVSLSGGISMTTVTDSNGFYSFTIPSGTSYNVSAYKAPLPPRSPAINTIDSIASIRFYLHFGTLACPAAADVDNDGTVNILDVISIQSFTLGNKVGIVGEYRFDPVIPTLDFKAMLMGDLL